MKTIKNNTELQTLINGNKPVLLDFYADWCGPCQSLLPIVEELSNEHKEDFEIVKINVDQHQAIAKEYGVRSIPALFFLKDGKIHERLTGLQPKSLLTEKINAYVSEVA